jgi:predicted transglutaminase-like cysteine proteinase
MFGRVAALALPWGFGAVLVLWPAVSGADLRMLAADAEAPTATAAAAAQSEQAPIPPAADTPPQPRDDIREAAKLATLEVAEPPTLAPAPALAEPFGFATLPVAAPAGILMKWSGVVDDIREERKILDRCRQSDERCPTVARNFLAIVAEGRAQTGRTRVGIINRAINLAIRPMSDLAQWGVPDRWSAPLDTFTTGRGDCEDYAIAKYVALTEAGIGVEDVRLVIVRNTAANEDHAVAAVRLDGSWIMLDNRWLTLVEDVAMPQVIPLFVLDNEGVRRFAPAAVTAMRRAPAPASLR